MNKLIKVKTATDLEGGRLDVSDLIVNAILLNLNTTKQNIYALSIEIEDEDGSVYDITVNRDYFIKTLNDNWIIQERHEKYEKCGEIKNAIEFLMKDLANVK